ncbi:dihydropteridine reductase [Candidatus Izimaplasma bacterium HR1]|jgi:nitroreductase|uniref:nitroreductase family protein n=1 Tax=Candidatus Izimoplasma sp. HR1 TaxID=1541959 RepID=UPI0004F853F8|nr:dihydropteridine reductase [Candidatus Izimaplasma bacterium HR1]
MDAITLLKDRRSVRKYKNEIVSKELMLEISELTKYSPSWGNLQIARYTFITDENSIKRIAEDGVKGFVYNIKTLLNARNVAVISYVKGKSGKLGKDEYATSKTNSWEVFDAGIATHQFCLAAYAKGVGTVIMGVIDDTVIREIIKLPEEESVGALIVYGFESGVHSAPTPRKDIKELIRFI